MPTSLDPFRPPSSPSDSQTAATAAASSLVAVTLVLLTSGTLTHHAGLLTWAMICGMVALDLVVLIVVKRMVDNGVARCAALVRQEMELVVARTAVKVGEAVAAGLRDSEDDGQPGTVTRVYSGG